MNPKESTESTPKSNVSLRHIAEAVGVSRMTASRAFKVDSQVNPQLRAKILETARQMGYKPDTIVSELMTSFVSRRQTHCQETFAAIWWQDRWEKAQQPGYDADIYLGLNEGAHVHGRAMDHLVITKKNTPKVIDRILKARNIQGLILTPPPSANVPAPDLPWEDFSTVYFGSSLSSPNLNRTQASHYGTMVTTLETIRNRGYQRPCLLSRSDLEKRTSRAYKAAFLAYDYPPEHIWHDVHSPDIGLEEWLKQTDPDVIIIDCDPWFHEIPASMKSRSLVSLCVNDPHGDVAGIYQNTAHIAKCTVDLLVRARLNHETGIPKNPVVMLTTGFWVEGHSMKKPATVSSKKKK